MTAPDLEPPPRFAVGGFQPFSTTDWPDHLAAVIFAQGCPLRCGYCHNPHLIRRGPGAISLEQVLATLHQRRDLLDGVVLSGGEPCAQPGLPGTVAAIRSMGLKAALHTSGAHPAALERVLPQVDWVGLDVKAAAADYARVAGAAAWRRTSQSLDLLLAHGGAFEVRTTWHPDLFSAHTLFDLAQNLAARGVAHYALQRLRQPVGNGRMQRWDAGPPPPVDVVKRLTEMFPHFILR